MYHVNPSVGHCEFQNVLPPIEVGALPGLSKIADTKNHPILLDFGQLLRWTFSDSFKY